MIYSDELWASEYTDGLWFVGKYRRRGFLEKFRRTIVRRYLPTNHSPSVFSEDYVRRNSPRNVLRRYIVFPMNSGLVCPHRNIVGSSSEWRFSVFVRKSSEGLTKFRRILFFRQNDTDELVRQKFVGIGLFRRISGDFGHQNPHVFL